MQMSATKHSSRVSSVATVSGASCGAGSDGGAVATCTAGASGGVGDVVGEVASTIAASAAAAAKTAGAGGSGSAIATSALETPVRSIAVGCGAFTGAVRNAKDSRIGTASGF